MFGSRGGTLRWPYTVLHLLKQFSGLDRSLPIGLRAEGGPALRLITYENLSSLCSASAGSTVFFKRGARCQRKSKWASRFSFIIRSVIGREGEAVFCFSYNRSPFGRSTFSSWYKIWFDSYCCLNSYCYFSSEGYLQMYSKGGQPVFLLRKFSEKMFVLLRTKRMQLWNHADTNSDAFPTLRGQCDIHIPY